MTVRLTCHQVASAGGKGPGHQCLPQVRETVTEPVGAGKGGRSPLKQVSSALQPLLCAQFSQNKLSDIQDGKRRSKNKTATYFKVYFLFGTKRLE